MAAISILLLVGKPAAAVGANGAEVKAAARCGRLTRRHVGSENAGVINRGGPRLRPAPVAPLAAAAPSRSPRPVHRNARRDRQWE
eukprot:366574-Chlamydomonas_euryale.AAC.16